MTIAPSLTTVLAWEDDPGVPPTSRNPIPRPSPDLNRSPLPVGIAGPAPQAGSDHVGSAEFRYWAAAEALRRAADYWAAAIPGGTTWNANVGPALQARLDEGDDLNAYYDRTGLSFFHHPVAGLVVYSGESPDVVCHELGHAVLDALRPQLWDAATSEIASFHESFADISALLSALQLESVRTRVLSETSGVLSRSSSLSRMAEQLGWAIRQESPQSVDADCLRNAANQFFYRDPIDLPPRAPANQLSSEVHSFSRIFTGAFLRVLAGVYQNTPKHEAGLQQATADAGRLLVSAVLQAPVTSGYYAQIAAHVIAADAAIFDGKNSRSIRAAFVRHGILSPQAAFSLTDEVLRPHRSAMAAFGPASDDSGSLADVEIDGAQYGVVGAFTVSAPAEVPRFAVASAATAGGSVQPHTGARAAAGFVEDLFRNGRVQVTAGLGEPSNSEEGLVPTHALVGDGTTRRLIRSLFD